MTAALFGLTSGRKDTKPPAAQLQDCIGTVTVISHMRYVGITARKLPRFTRLG
ncbi:MAG TPA: hypothetical protein VH519_05890 [Hyphomicrobiaceae bacterium]|jgi:hypothetical protein